MTETTVGMIKVFRMPIHDCPRLGRRIPVMQLQAHRKLKVCHCEYCLNIIAHFERRENLEEVPEGV